MFFIHNTKTDSMPSMLFDDYLTICFNKQI